MSQLGKDGVVIKKAYFSQLVSQGKIPFHHKPSSTKKFFKYVEVSAALESIKDPTREPQRQVHSKKRDAGVFDEMVIPKNSLATMTDDERKKHSEELQRTVSKLKDISSDEENSTRPDMDAPASEWNTFKVMQQGLNYELDRKVKEKRLMYVDDFKATVELMIGPLNQGLDDLAFNLKSQYPNTPDEVIQWLLDRANQLKVDVQNVSV